MKYVPVRDWDDTGDPREWSAELDDWKAAQRDASRRQSDDRKRLDAAQGRLGILSGCLSTLKGAAEGTAAGAAALDILARALGTTDANLAAVSDEIADHDQAREIATARVLGGPSTATPLVLVPLRLQTHWDARTLAVRIYPDVVSVDSHDPRLTTTEQDAGQAYWHMRTAATPAGAQQAWENLVRQAGAPRAAWIARATDPDAQPAGSAPATRDTGWDIAVNARLLPQRFAVMAYNAGQPINLAAAGQPPRYVTWTAPVAEPLAIDALHDPGSATWMTDLPAAIEAGMAVRIDTQAVSHAIEELVVVGVHEPHASDHALADLLDAHAFTRGLEILADRAPTNNSDEIRAPYSPEHDADVAGALTDRGRAPQLPDASAGAQLADLLGVPRSRLAAVAGASSDRRSAYDAAALIVGLAANGRLRPGTDDSVPEAWPLLRPAGPAPVLRVGRQPYGVLPVTAPGRWRPADGELSAPLAALLQRWGRAYAAQVDVDPDDLRSRVRAARRVTRGDESALNQLLLESPSSLTWTDDATLTFTGLDGLVGDADGDGAPGVYLAALADAPDAQLDTVAAALPATLLARVALAARRRARDADRPALVAALHRLADHATPAAGRADLARLLTESLDTLCHRVDAWLTAPSSERLATQRRAPGAGPTALGAYGYLTDVAPRTVPRTHGHIHAPSLAHAATAAVLRSGYLGQRKVAWATGVAHARWLAAHTTDPRGQAIAGAALRAALAGLAALSPLPDDEERALPLAIDLSSRRVRQARWVLSAVRAGQPLAAVLGYQFERDLADAGLQRYLSAFRKLTRFGTGTQLEALETTRRAARDVLAERLTQLAGLQAAVPAAQSAIDATAAALSRAQSAEQQARTIAAPYLQMKAALDDLTARIPALEAAVTNLDGQSPAPGVERRRISVP